jgi:hypothetical protein
MIDPQNANVAIVVASRDASIDLWAPLFLLLRKNWPSCPFPLYLITNTIAYTDQGVSSITVGADRSWSDTLGAALEQITQPYVFLWIDDHFLIEQVNDQVVLGAIAAFQQLGGNYLRLQALPRPDEPCNEHFGILRTGAVYRASVVASIWKRTVLADLLRPGESAWDFEGAGSTRSNQYDGFFSSWRTCLHLENLLIKGKVRSTALRRIQRSLDPDDRTGSHVLKLDRPVMTSFEEAEFAVRIAGNRALITLPRRFANKVRNVVLQGRAS